MWQMCKKLEIQKRANNKSRAFNSGGYTITTINVSVSISWRPLLCIPVSLFNLLWLCEFSANIPSSEASTWPRYRTADGLLGLSPMMSKCGQDDEEDVLNTSCHWARTFSGWFMDETLVVAVTFVVSHLVREQHRLKHWAVVHSNV